MRGAMGRAGVALMLLVVLATGCTDASGPGTVHVVVDTDMGQDDAMALLYLLQHPNVRIGARHGERDGPRPLRARRRERARAARGGRGTRTDPGRLRTGITLPGTMPAGAFPDDWRAATDDLHGVELPATDRSPSPTPAPELLRSAIIGAGEPVRLLTLGPLTNVALAFRGDPQLAERIERVVIMGGAVDVPGNALENPLAEFNVWVDPVAAGEVFGSGAEIDLVPLDATQDVPVTPFFAEALAEHHVTPEADLVHALVRAQPHLVEGGFWFWDPLAAAVLVDPSLATFERQRISVPQGTSTIQGWTVHDAAGSPMDVAVGADGLGFERRLLNTLNGDDAIRTTRPEPFATASISVTGCTWETTRTPAPGLGAVRLEAVPNASTGIAVVALLEGHTTVGLQTWIESQDGLVREEPPPWIAVAAFVQAASGPLAAVPLEPGSYAVACGDAAGRVEILGAFDVAS